ncbi:MAG TPA: hydantoinase B/oxoprolinase family protein [Chloroflexota bacterium]|nr:hydantoinase B/oxoprolinase family protein [Chloroflexota bacterium]
MARLSRYTLWQINDEQGRTIINVSGSPVAYEANDMNTVIADPSGATVFVGPYMTILVGPLSLIIRNVLATFGADGVHPGDMYITNDPWLGAVHQNDMILVAPVHWEGELVAWVASSIHQVDVGGPVPGSWNPSATDTFQEAPRYRFLRVVRDGVVQPEVVATYLTNSRVPHLLELDLRAQIAAANVAKERLAELLRQRGVGPVRDTLQDCLDYTEFRLRRRLRELPDGRWYAESYIDHNGHQEGLYAIRLTLIKRGEQLIFDYTATDAESPGFINATYASALGWTFAAILTNLCPDLPWNEGALRPVEIRTREGTLHHARFPRPVSSGPVNAGWATHNAACAALARMLAASETHRHLLMATWAGSVFIYNSAGINQYGEPFATMFIHSPLQGGGARYAADGHDVGGLLHAPRPSVTNVESAEANFPLLYLWRKRAVDSGGPGRYRGGVSAASAITPYGTEELELVVNTVGSDQSCTVGLDGGYPGGGAQLLVWRGAQPLAQLAAGRPPRDLAALGGAPEVLPPKYRLRLRPGDVLVGVPHGGGGFGDPLTRDPEHVARDVREGYVSAAASAAIYGVVLDPSGAVDAEATAARRAALRAERLREGRPWPGSPAEMEENDASGPDAAPGDRSPGCL